MTVSKGKIGKMRRYSSLEKGPQCWNVAKHCIGIGVGVGVEFAVVFKVVSEDTGHLGKRIWVCPR